MNEHADVEALWARIAEQRAEIERHHALLQEHRQLLTAEISRLAATGSNRRPRRLPRLGLTALVSGVLALLLTSVTYASIPGPHGQVTFCYGGAGQQGVNIIDSTLHCASNQHEVKVYAPSTEHPLAIKWGGTGSSTQNFVDLQTDQTIAGVKTFSSPIAGSVTGNAGTVTNGVYTTGDQTIAGTKTFSQSIAGSITGNAGTVTNGVYTAGNQTIAGVKTFSSPIAGSVTGNAGTVTNGVYTSGDQTIGGNKTFTGGLTAQGTINNTAGGVRYPDGNLQTTAGPLISTGVVNNTATVVSGTGFSVAVDTSAGYVLYKVTYPAGSWLTNQQNLPVAQGSIFRAGTAKPQPLAVDGEQLNIDGSMNVWFNTGGSSLGFMFSIIQRAGTSGP